MKNWPERRVGVRKRNSGPTERLGSCEGSEFQDEPQNLGLVSATNHHSSQKIPVQPGPGVRGPSPLIPFNL